jgi:hypothetical protein
MYIVAGVLKLSLRQPSIGMVLGSITSIPTNLINVCTNGNNS